MSSPHFENTSNKTNSPIANTTIEKEPYYQMLVENSDDGMLLTTLDGRVLDANPAATRISGYSKEEFLKLVRHDIIDTPDHRVKEFFERREREGYARGEMSFQHKNGSFIPLEVTSRVFQTENGEFLASLSFRDMSEKKRVEEALRSSEALYHGVINSMLEGVIILRSDSTIIEANASAERILGLPRYELLGKTLFDPHWEAIHEDGSTFPPESFPASVTLNTGKPCSGVIMGLKVPDNSVRWISINSQPVFEGESLSSVLVTFADVTEQKLAEQKLRRSENTYRTLAQNLPDSAILIFDQNLRFLVAEGGSLSQNGFIPENVEGKTLQEVLPQASVERLLPYYQAALAGLENTFENPFNGRTYLNKTIPVRNEQNEVIFGIFFCQDITALKRAEELLAEEKDQLLTTLRCIGDGVITTDREGKVTLLNQVAEELTGWSQASAKGRPISEVFNIIDRTTRKPQISRLKEAFDTGEVISLKQNTVLISRSSREIPISDSCAPICGKGSNITGAVLVFQDITEQERIAQENLKSSKLESLGILAGGIAHDFNNLLTGITLNLSHCKSQLEVDQLLDRKELKEVLLEVEEATLRSKKLIQQLLTFARGGSPIKKATNLRSLIQEEASFVVQGSFVQLICDYSEEVKSIEIDSEQLGQVIRNIVLNASQAMLGKGHLWIKTDRVELSDDEIPPLKAGKFVRVSVRDEGSGIRPEYLSKIFDPYFTTKTSGNGLGLAAAYSIIRQHNGHITAESEVGKGTTFNIFLPLNFSTVDNTGKSQSNQKAAYAFPFGPKKILIMDDEEMLLNVLKRMFGTLGKELVVARDGNEALRLYREALEMGSPFELVTLDLMVPGGMGGKETMEKLLEMDPAVTAIVISGYSNDPVMANYREYGFQAALGKPFQLEDIYRLLVQLYSK